MTSTTIATEALITCDTWDTDYIEFLKSWDTWDTAYMWHGLHCWQLRTTSLRITLWSWIALRQGQHSQFLRCFETEISVLETFPRGKWLFRGWIRQRAISKRPTYFSCFNFWRMIIKRQYAWPRISQNYTLLFHVLLNLYKHCTLLKGEVKKRVYGNYEKI